MAGQAGHNGGGLTYAEAGVDIDAGNELVERIKPAAKRTRATPARKSAAKRTVRRTRA